ncbi:hypothetical protein ACIREE_13040 [Streptomyces sp. NPDC102467]|uniref:hypothetical protein n=1 Tax=Streptomyces sp. NPDC102467 TaxID=3366179 RepID=UPI0037FF3685
MRGRVRRTAPVLGLAVLAIGLAGCGVPPSEVVEVGEPATGLHPATEVYFLIRDTGVSRSAEPGSAPAPATDPGGVGGTADGDPSTAERATPSATAGAGALHAVPRPAASGTDPVSYAVRQLAAGPTAGETDGLTTALPRLKNPSRVTAETGRRADSLVVRFPAGTARLTEPALRQVACTAARAYHAQRTAGGQNTTKPAAVPAPTTGEASPAHGLVKIWVTDRHGAADKKASDGWEVTVTNSACPS